MRVSKPTNRSLVSVVVALFAVISLVVYTQTSTMTTSSVVSEFPVSSAIVIGAVVTSALVVGASYLITVEETSESSTLEAEQ